MEKDIILVMIKDFVGKFVGHPYTQLVALIFTVGGSYISNVLSDEKFLPILLLICSGALVASLCITVIRIRKNKIDNYVHTLSQCAEKLSDTMGDLRNDKIESRAALKPHLNLVCEQMKKSFESLYSILSKRKCSFGVCIKEIVAPEIYDDNPYNWRTLTIARACDDSDRTALDSTPQEVAQNTSFIETIMFVTPWTSRNLVKTKSNYEKARKTYLNPDPKYLDFYKSTIVVPIKQQKDLVSTVVKEYGKNNSCGDIHYLGFLCIDSLTTFTDKDKNFVILVRLAKFFAQLLYPFFEEYLVHKIRKVEDEKQ